MLSLNISFSVYWFWSTIFGTFNLIFFFDLNSSFPDNFVQFSDLSLCFHIQNELCSSSFIPFCQHLIDIFRFILWVQIENANLTNSKSKSCASDKVRFNEIFCWIQYIMLKSMKFRLTSAQKYWCFSYM